MKVQGFSTEWDEKEELQTIEIQDINISANPNELRELAEFPINTAVLHESGNHETCSIELFDSKPNPETGICFMVHAVKERI